MDDPFENKSPLSGISIGRLIKNILTGLFLVASLCLGTFGVLTLVNPQNPYNPYPPPTLPPTIGPPTPTNTPAIYLPTEIPPSATPRPLPTAVPTATETLVATETPLATVTAEPVTAEPGAQFQLQSGSPTWTTDPLDCERMGVGGWAFSNQSPPAPIFGLAVEIGGQLAGIPLGPTHALTGSASAFRLGPGAYYFELATTPTASNNTVTVQLVDISSGLPLSDKVFVNTFATCDQNLIFVNWNQAGP